MDQNVPEWTENSINMGNKEALQLSCLTVLSRPNSLLIEFSLFSIFEGKKCVQLQTYVLFKKQKQLCL